MVILAHKSRLYPNNKCKIKLSGNFDICKEGIEDFGIAQFVIKNKLAKHIFNAGWGMFRRMLRYKAENAGKAVISVESRGTTQRCSSCRKEVPKGLWDR